MATVFPHQWLVGALFACAGLYELTEALTHRLRWINARLKATRDGKTVDMHLTEHDITTISSQAKGTIQISGFNEIVPATKGVFLIPDSGVSIYIPAESVNPSDMYTPLITSWTAVRNGG